MDPSPSLGTHVNSYSSSQYINAMYQIRHNTNTIKSATTIMVSSIAISATKFSLEQIFCFVCLRIIRKVLYVQDLPRICLYFVVQNCNAVFQIKRVWRIRHKILMTWNKLTYELNIFFISYTILSHLRSANGWRQAVFVYTYFVDLPTNYFSDYAILLFRMHDVPRPGTRL